MKVAIIKYNAGNVRSVIFALDRIGIEPILTDDPQQLSTADKVIFPGVGEASTTMKYLRDKNLEKVIVNLKQPVLGICLGMQLMCKHSEEGNTDCLGIFDQHVLRFNDSTALQDKVSRQESVRGSSKIPQTGWNTIYNLKGKLFERIPENSFMYFVHSYYVELGTNTIATTNYITEYSSGLHKNNFYAVQFHPEKSSEAGEKILENFIKL
jgi:glutamine amidotransferase